MDYKERDGRGNHEFNSKGPEASAAMEICCVRGKEATGKNRESETGVDVMR